MFSGLCPSKVRGVIGTNWYNCMCNGHSCIQSRTAKNSTSFIAAIISLATRHVGLGFWYSLSNISNIHIQQDLLQQTQNITPSTSSQHPTINIPSSKPSPIFPSSSIFFKRLVYEKLHVPGLPFQVPNLLFGWLPLHPVLQGLKSRCSRIVDLQKPVRDPAAKWKSWETGVTKTMGNCKTTGILFWGGCLESIFFVDFGNALLAF